MNLNRKEMKSDRYHLTWLILHRMTKPESHQTVAPDRKSRSSEVFWNFIYKFWTSNFIKIPLKYEECVWVPFILAKVRKTISSCNIEILKVSRTVYAINNTPTHFGIRVVEILECKAKRAVNCTFTWNKKVRSFVQSLRHCFTLNIYNFIVKRYLAYSFTNKTIT